MTFFSRILSALIVLVALNGGAMAETTKVGFVYLTTPGDHGWTYAHELGRQMLVERFGDSVETTVVENVTEGPDATRVIRQLAQADNDIIFATSFGYMDSTVKVAKEFPNIKFEHITGYKRLDNLSTGNIRFYEGRYVSGVAAGLMSESGKVGYIASFPIPEVVMGINAFAQGLRSINPDATISVIWLNTWYDPIKEADAAKVHIAAGADILAQHTDSPAMLQIAERAGVHGFGQSSDMISFAPQAQLFANLNNWGVYYVERVQALKEKRWESSSTWGGLASGMMKLSQFSNMPPEVVAKVGEARDKIISGEINVFTGPLKTNTGKQVIGEGEVLGDPDLWQMNYYLEGVIGSVPG